MKLNPKQYLLDEEKVRLYIFRAGMEGLAKPTAVLLGGQPGAGKSKILDDAFLELIRRGDTVQIVGDDLRGFHPMNRYLLKRDDKTAAFYTDLDSGRWVKKAIDEAKARRLNIIVEGTMRNSAIVAETVAKLRPEYEIDVRVLAVNFRLSEQGIMLRYEGQKAERGVGRWTTPKAHKDGYDGMPATIEHIERERIAVRVAVYKRDGRAIYSNEFRGGKWSRAPQARAVVEAERDRPMTSREFRDYVEGFDRLAEALARPERRASAGEIDKIESMRRQARKEWHELISTGKILT
ncbi:MAG: zeta toxin family protein [Azoarcus sp.]|nr:zeta toxin family protein [Azoarcus sp.]